MNQHVPRVGWAARLVAGALSASAMVLGIAAATTYGQPAPQSIAFNPPPVPADIEVPTGNTLFYAGHAVGTQNYVCLPSDTGVAFTLFTPQATLFSGDDEQVATHSFRPNPFEDGTVRASWQDSRDTSTVWGQAIRSSSDPAIVAPDAIAWVVLRQVGAQAGPDGGDALTATTYIQRLNTSGGVAPSTGCNSSTDIGHQAFVPYEADYFFYRKAD
jgi:hypothetical protein